MSRPGEVKRHCLSSFATRASQVPGTWPQARDYELASPDSPGFGRARRCVLLRREAQLPRLAGVRAESARAPATVGGTRLGSTCAHKHCHKAVSLRAPPPSACPQRARSVLPATLTYSPKGQIGAENDRSRFDPSRPKGLKQTCITH